MTHYGDGASLLGLPGDKLGRHHPGHLCAVFVVQSVHNLVDFLTVLGAAKIIQPMSGCPEVQAAETLFRRVHI